MIVTEGEAALLKMLFRGDNTIVAAGGNFYLGLCSQVPVKSDTLASIITEPSSQGGYSIIYFLTNVSSGSSGILLMYSGAYSSLVTLLNGQTYDLQFEFYP